MTTLNSAEVKEIVERCVNRMDGFLGPLDDKYIRDAISEALSRARSVPEGEPGIDFKDIVEQFLAKATEEELCALLDTDEMLALAKDKTPWLQWAAEYNQQQALSSRIPSGELGELLKEVYRLRYRPKGYDVWQAVGEYEALCEKFENLLNERSS